MSESSKWTEAVIEIRQPLDPIATSVTPRLERLTEVRAVVFDVYGTLVISGTGDVGSADVNNRGCQIRAAMNAVGWQGDDSALPTIDQLHQQIRQSNDHQQSETCPKPEVDIVDIWRRTLRSSGLTDWANDARRVVAIAAEYEARSNPTWPMPGASDLIGHLSKAGLAVGIVSNAQVFTPGLVDDLANGSSTNMPFDLDLCIYSYRYRQAKPGPRLFRALSDGLKRRGILPHEAVYVGNDMLNDMWAATESGLRTAWFAGDARSCRDRMDDPRCRSLRPDVVLTNLMQLLDCLVIG